MKQSTFSAVMANSIKNLLQRYTKGIRFTAILTLLFTLGVGSMLGADTWVRVTSTADILSGGTFIIGYEATANSGQIVPMRTNGANATITANGYLYSGTGTGTTTNSNTINMASPGTTTNYEVTITAYNSSQIELKMADGKYISFTGTSNNNLKLATSSSTSTRFTIAMGTNNVVTLASANSSYTARGLRYNSSSPRFSNYSKTTQKGLVLYKKSASCSYNINYTTNNKADGAGGTWSEGNCFEQVGSTTEWRYEMTLPGAGGSFWVGNGAWVNNKSEVQSLSTITFVGLQGTSCGSKPYPGEGAVGYVRIYSDSGSKNYYAAFQPTYQIAFGIEGQTWTHKPFTSVSGNKYETDLLEIPSNFSSSYNYYVGPKKSDNTTIWVAGKSSTVAMNTMGGMTDVNAVKGSKGVFRIYDNYCDNNWYCSFIPYYNYKLLNDDGSVFYTSTYVSSEAANKTTTIYSTKPTKTGHTFVGWNRTQNATTAEVTAGASYTYWKANDTFYPVWKKDTYTITSNLTNCSSSPAIPSSYTYTGSAANLTYTIIPSAGYALPDAVTVSGTTYTWDKATGKLTLTGTISSNVTITITAKKVYTITWKVNKQTYTTGTPTTTVYEGSTYEDLTLPTAPADGTLNDCYPGKKFVGWSTTNIGSTERDKPSILFKSTSEAPSTAITENKTLCAVFATESTIDGETVNTTASVTIANYADSKSWSNDTRYTSVIIDNNVTASVSNGTNTGKYYTSDDTWRLYANESGTLTISTSEGSLSSITLTFTTKDNGKISYGSSALTSGTSVSVSGTSATFTVGQTSGSKGKVFITGISVTYTTTGESTTETTGYVTECCTLNNITLDGSGTVTGGTFSATAEKACKGEEITLTATAAECYEFVSWIIKKTSDGSDVTSSVLSGNILTMPDYAVTVSAAFKSLSVTEIALAMTGGHQNLDIGQTNQLLVTYTPADATCDNAIVSWTSSDDNVMSVSNTGLVTAERAGNATITAKTEGGVTATYTITVNNPACASWYLHYWNRTTGGDECFYKVKPDDPNDHEWRTGNFSLPSNSDEDKFNVNNANGGDPTYKTDQIFRTGIGFADIQRGEQNCGTNPYPGQDAYGQLSIYDDSNTPNRYIAFYPAQYLVTYGKEGAASWEVLPFKNTTGYEYETEPFMVPNGYKTDDTYKYYVGIINHHGNIMFVTDKSSVDAMNTVSGLSVNDMAGKWGTWHIYSNSCDANWYCEFISYYRVDFNLNGGEGDFAPRYGKATEPYVKFTTTDIGAPTRTGYTFLGWKDQNNKIYAPTGATVTINNDYTLTALWIEEYPSNNCRWEEVTIDDIEYGDEVVIATVKNGSTYALKDGDGGASSAPLATQITINPNNTINTSETPISTPLIWNIDYDKEGTKNLVIYSTKNAGQWLYSINNNNGIRIGTNSDKEFKIVEGTGDDAGNFFLYHIAQARYLGVYYTNKDWRGYTTINSQITGQTLKFYKKVCLPEGQYRVTWDANGGQWSDGSTTKEEVYAEGATINKPDKPKRDGYEFTEWAPNLTTMPDENTTSKAQWAELYTVNFYSNGIEVCSFEEIAGQTVNCTNTPTTCDDEYPHFIGWTDTEIDGVATDKPALVTLPLTVSKSQDYHAVFAKGTLATGGDAETVTFANSGYSNQQTISTVTLTNATITFAKGSNNNNAPKYYTTGAAIRCYGGNTFTVTSNNEITKISFTFATGEDDNKILASTGTYSNGTWTGSAKSITFTIDGSSGHRRIASISVTAGSPEKLTAFITSCCTPWTAPTLSTNTSIAVGGTTTITHSGTTYGDVTYTSSNTAIATVDANGKVTGVKPGKTTITASWDGVDGAGNYCPAEATIDITVTGSFTITYDANHASATGATTATTIAYPTGQGTVATNGFALAEHQFVKWNTSADGSGTSYSEGASITLTDNITLYAIWQRYCTITYVIPTGGGTLVAGATTTVVAGGAVQMPGIENNSIDIEYSCEELIGWTTQATYENANGQKPTPFYAIGANFSGITQNTTLYAVYSRTGNGAGGTVTLTATEMEGWATAQSYGTERELETCVGTWKTTGVKSTGNPIQIKDSYYVQFPELQGNITQVVLNATNGSNTTLTSGTFTLKTIDGQTITSATVNSSGVCTLTVTGSHKTARLYSSVTARIANISISYGPAAIVSTNLKCTNDYDECTITYDLNESFLPTGTTVLGACADATFLFSEIGTYTICASPRANEHQLLGWNNQCDGKGSINYTPGQVISSLPQNNIVLYAQWAPQVIVHDSYEETFVYPTEAGGSITLNPGTQGCDPKKYDFIGWTDVNPLIGNSTESPWNQTNTPPTLLPTNLDGTVTYTPDGPSEVYAVYALEDQANSKAFRLSLVIDGNTYYLGYASSRIKATGIDDALVLYKEVINVASSQYKMYYVDGDGEKQYVYCNSAGNLGTSTNPDENWGWTISQLGSGYTFTSINYNSSTANKLSMNTNNASINTTGSVFNMETVAEYQYVAKTNCSDQVTITFVPGNGTMTPSNTTVTAKPSDVITLPTCEFSGWTFLGWVTDNVEETERPNVMTIYTGTFEVGNSDITLYAYYTCDPEPVPFDGNTDGVWKIYSEVTSGTYKYANSHTSNNPATLPASDYCPNAEDWTFVNAGEPYKYYIKNEAGKYLTPENEVNTGFTFGTTPQVWNIESAGNDLYKISHADIPGRLIMCGTTAFYNTVKANIDNPAWHLVSIGGCTNSVYTTDPQEKEAISIAGTLKITSAVGQTVKAADKIILSMKNMPATQVVNISADNLTFYNENNQVVTSLQAGDNGSLTAVLAVAYTPTEADKLETPQIKIEYAGKIRGFRNVTCRSLPNTFAIVAKVGEMWYALPSQGLNSTTPPAAYPVEVDNMTDPTAVTAVPTNADWSLRQVYKSTGTNDRFTANGHNLVFVNDASPEKALNASKDYNYLLTDAQYNNYHNATNPGLYEWTPTTSDLETYQLTNVQRTTKKININTNTVFGVHASDVVTTDVRFLPIQQRYTPLAAQVVEWKENSLVIMYNGDPAQTASVTVNDGTAQTTTLSSAQKDIAVYELTASNLSSNPRQLLKLVIGTEQMLLPIPYIIGSEKTDLAILGDGTVAARQDVAKVADLVVLNGGKLTAAGAKSNPYKFRNVTIYGGGKLVIPSDKGFGVASLTLRAGGITDAGEYDYVYPQFELRGTFTNSAAKINYDYITDYDHWYHLVLPFAGDLEAIKYPTEFYGTNVTADNTGSWVIKRYAGEIRATGNYNAWVDIESEDATTTTAGKGYIFWGAPKKVSVNGGTKVRQQWGIQRITMPITAGNAIDAENDKEGGKTISGLGSYEDIAHNSGKPNDQGWNLIGNPYMVDLTNMSTAGLHACKLVEVKDPATGKWNGQWEWNDETNIRYLTIPSDHFDTYTAKTVTQAVPLVPGRAFFVQLEGNANGVTFSAANRASLMPQHLAAQNTAVEVETGIVLSSETMQDEVNFWIKDGKTNDYEYNADYPKTPNNTNFNIYGVHAHGDLSWVATGPEYAEESMPIGYQVPAAGTYTLSISETYYSDLLDALYVTDHAMSPELTVDLMNAPYEFSVNQAETNNERFTVSLKLKSENQGPATGLENIGVQTDGTIKFIYHDKIFILHNGTIYDATGKKVTTINK